MSQDTPPDDKTPVPQVVALARPLKCKSTGGGIPTPSRSDGSALMKYTRATTWVGIVALSACGGGSDRSTTVYATLVSVEDGQSYRRAEVEFEVEGGAEYEITAEGLLVADDPLEPDFEPGDGTATIDLEVHDRVDDILSGAATVTLDAESAGGTDILLDGRTDVVGRGSGGFYAEPGSVTNILIPFGWEGQRPGSGWNAGLAFERDPDIAFWTVAPAPTAETGEDLSMLTSVETYAEDPHVTVIGFVLGSEEEAEFELDERVPEVGDLTDGTLFEGVVTAPLTAEIVVAGITATDADGQSTTTTKGLCIVEPGTPVAHDVTLIGGVRGIAVRELERADVGADSRLTVQAEGHDGERVIPVEGAQVLFHWDIGDGQVLQLRAVTDATGAISVTARGATGRVVKGTLTWVHPTNGETYCFPIEFPR